MKIDEIKLTKAEMNEAVQRYLQWMNIKVEVESIEQDGYPSRGWCVGIKGERLESVPLPVKHTFTSVEDLGKAIENEEPI